jgi:dCTP deaminase
MYLSDRDLKWAIEKGHLIVEPKPTQIDPTSIDLHLDSADQAKIWDIDTYNNEQKIAGRNPCELNIGKFDFRKFSPKWLIRPTEDHTKPVFRRGEQIIVRPGGFLLWQTKESVGTTEGLIAFVDGKSLRARTGIIVHLTAPTIHATWSGHITLEIANVGPFHFVLEAGDSIAQLIVAKISSTPSQTMKNSVTYNQTEVTTESTKK